MILNTSFFAPTGNLYTATYSNVSATITIPVSAQVWDNVRVTNATANVVFMNISTTNPGNIVAPTTGANGSSNVFSVPPSQTSFISTGITSPGNVYISTISAVGSGAVGVQTGSFL
jgi:hypothetical protein